MGLGLRFHLSSYPPSFFSRGPALPALSVVGNGLNLPAVPRLTNSLNIKANHMTKPLIALLSITISICSCTGKAKDGKTSADEKVISQHNAPDSNRFYGTWVRQDKRGFTLIEINDTSDVLYYQVSERQNDSDTDRSDRYWYYRSKATMGYWSKHSIWIATDKFRFDYNLKGDTLMEFDKMGEQGMFFKVFTDEQKAYKAFNSAMLNGVITFVNKVGPSEYFVLNNLTNEFSFTSIPDAQTGNKLFTDLAETEDSVIKARYSDTLILIKRQSGESYKFGFVRLNGYF